MPRSFLLSELALQLGGQVLGDDCRVNDIAPLEMAGPDQLSFVAQAKYRPQVAASRAAAVVLKPEWAGSADRPAVLVANPYAWFARAQALFHPAPAARPGIHARAWVASDAAIDPTAEIAAGAIVEAGAVVGARSVVHPGVVLGKHARIGADCIIYPNVVIYHACEMGDRCIVHAGAVIGADGFGNAMDNGAWVKIPQIGRVIIGNDVEIGANTTIDRGAMSDTVIADDVKIDNLIMVAHNVRIGAHTAIAGCVGIAGSTTIGEYCTIGGASMINGHIEIGDRVHCNGGTLVTRSLESGKSYAGYPLFEVREWQKNAVHLRHLDEMATALKNMQQRLDELEQGKGNN